MHLFALFGLLLLALTLDRDDAAINGDLTSSFFTAGSSARIRNSVSVSLMSAVGFHSYLIALCQTPCESGPSRLGSSFNAPSGRCK